VAIGRPKDRAELAALVAAYPRVKAVGVGHSWWREQFCAGDDGSAINVVVTELEDTLPSFTAGPLEVPESAIKARRRRCHPCAHCFAGFALPLARRPPCTRLAPRLEQRARATEPALLAEQPAAPPARWTRRRAW
jgi:hypothetical protein